MIPNPLSFLVAFAITAAGLFLLKPLAIRLDLVDKPGGRKLHEGHIPLIGGVAMFLGFGFALLTLPVSLSLYRCLIACSALLVITGVLDDFHELAPRGRLIVQLIVAVLVVTWGNNYLKDLGNLFYLGDVHLGYFGYPITVVAILAVINAMNMTDGADGLAGTVAFVEFIFLAWMAYRVNQYVDLQIIYLVLAIVLAFLCFNFPLFQKARVFMGDSGSMLLGLVLVWFCVDLSQTGGASHPVTFLWILAVPLWDISSVVIRRVLRGFSPLKADRGHLHHYLLEKGFSSLQVTLFIGAMSAALGLIGMLGEYCRVPESVMFGAFIGLFVLYLILLHRAWTRLTAPV